MKKHLNTLYVTTEGSYLAKEGEAVVVRRDGESAMRVPIHMLDSVVCFGHVKMSVHAMALCAGRGVAISFMSPQGRFLARVHGFTRGSVLLRRAQFRASEAPERALELARVFVQAKLYNARVLVLRAIRDHSDPTGRLATEAEHLRRCIRGAAEAQDMNRLRGIEGEGSRHYLSALWDAIRNPDPAFRTHERSRRPPRDPVNALLSFVYALLASDLRSACEAVGLDPQVGFLHADRPGRPALALDLMEELRPVLADRTVLSLINRQQVNAADFIREVGGAMRMRDQARKEVLVQYQKRKAEEIEHPFLGEKVTLGIVPLLQARLLAKAIRGEVDAYPAYLWR